MAKFLKSFGKIFRRKNRQLACTMHLSDPNHVHGDACFVEVLPLSVVELYQSQGCKSCPPAIAPIHKAVADPNLLLLTYDVTYWDNPDWKDTFGNSAWDARQRAYIMKWGRTGIFTPQVIVDGVADGVGARNGEVEDIISKARNAMGGQAYSVSIDRLDSSLVIKSDLSEAPTNNIWLVAYDPTSSSVKITKGANKGKKFPYRNIVISCFKLGEWRGGEVTVPLPSLDGDGLEKVVLVQGENGGPIVSALKL